MSVYRVIDVIGTSTTSWEEAAADSDQTPRASRSEDLRVAEVIKQDSHVGEGGELVYRTKIQLSLQVRGGIVASLGRSSAPAVVTTPTTEANCFCGAAHRLIT
jgi:flavin-binding protein dodecin